jgi:hypothetical protein
MQPPPRHEMGPGMVWPLHNACYGLKQAAHSLEQFKISVSRPSPESVEW